MTEKEKKVYEILLTSIICDINVKKICMQDNFIYSPQLYNSNLDEDMSDFSVGFYEIVYKDILKENNGKILKENGKYINENYMGDTIYSFNSLAYAILGDRCKDCRSTKEMWTEELIIIQNTIV